MQLTITARVRHGLWWKARKVAGTSKKLASILGISQQRLGRWINLREIPNTKRLEERNPLLASKIELLCGSPIDVVFPQSLRGSDWLIRSSKTTEREVEIPLSQLLNEPQSIQALAHQEEALFHQDMCNTLDAALRSLSAREEQVLALRFGLDDGHERTQQDVAFELGLTRTRIQQIEKSAMSKLRHHTRLRPLKAAWYGLELPELPKKAHLCRDQEALTIDENMLNENWKRRDELVSQ